MSLSHTPQELAAMEGPSREMINERLVLNLRERNMLNVIVNWSLAEGREWASFASIEDLAKWCVCLRPHASATLIELEDKKLVQSVRRRGLIRLRFLASSGDLIEPPLRLDPRELAELTARTRGLNAIPAGFEPGGQKLLEIKTADEQHADELARMSQERAEELTSDAYQIGTPDEIGTDSVRSGSGDPYRIGTPPGRITAAGARTRARHVHVPTSVPQSMLHVHEHAPSAAGEENAALRALSHEELWSRLDEESRYVLGQLPEIFGEEGARKFSRTWMLRFCDRWKHEAFSAIGETKRMKIAGARFIKGPGQCANDLFHRFKHSRKATA